MSGPNIGVDGAPFVQAMRPILEALADLRAALAQIDNMSPRNLRAQMLNLRSTLEGTAISMQKAFKELPAELDKAVKDASGKGKAAAKKVGKEVGDALADSTIATVRARRAQVQAEYEALAALRARTIPELQQARQGGASLFAGDKLRLAAFEAEARNSGKVLALRRQDMLDEQRLAQERQALVARAGAGLAALRAKLAAEEAAAQLRAARNANAGIDRNAGFGAMSRAGQLSRATRVSGALAGGMSEADAAARYGAAALAAAKNLGEFQRAGAGAAGTMGNLNGLLREGHSLTRGLASGFNAMWLTWGSIAPLLVGAAVSNAFVQTIKKGAEFEQRLAAIRYLGGESAQAVDQLAQSTLDLARVGVKGPLEIATALKALSLAGLNAKEQLAALKPVLNFSVAGELEAGKAAESLVAISTAFGYSATGFGTVADVISKAAAISMSSVESMTESFKQASTVAQQYGVTVQDAATSLALLSQSGIRGTAAGTAMRNMYNELMGSSKRAEMVLSKVFKTSIFDEATKAVRPLTEIVRDLAKELSGMSFEKQQKALQALGNERGLKSLSAVLMAFNQEAKELGKGFENRLDEIVKTLQEAPGFAALAGIGLAQTTSNQIKGVFASLEAALVETFGVVSPTIQVLAQDMRALFNSEEFRSGLQSLVVGIADFIRLIADSAKVLAAMATGYLAAKAAMLLTLGAQALLLVSTPALTAGLLALGVTATGVAGTFTVLNAAAGAIGLILVAGGLAYLAFSKDTETAMEKATFAVDGHYAATKEAMEAEIERLAVEKQAMIDVLTGKVASYNVEARIAVRRLDDLAAQEVATARVMAVEKKRINQQMRDTPYAQTAQGAKAVAALQSDRDIDETVRFVQQGADARKRNFINLSDLLKQSANDNKLIADAMAAKTRRMPTGPDGDVSELRAGLENAANAKKEFLQKEIANFFKASDTLERGFAERLSAEESMQKVSLALRLTTESEYGVAIDRLQDSTMASRKANLEADIAQAKVFKQKLIDEAAKDKPVRGSAEKLAADVDALEVRIDQKEQALKTLNTEADNQARQRLIKRAEGINKALDDLEKFRTAELDSQTLAREKLALEESTAGMSERNASIEMAGAKKRLEFLAQELKIRKAIDDYKASGGDAGLLAAAEAELKGLQGAMVQAVDNARGEAAKLFDKGTQDEITKTLSDAIEAGLSSGKGFVDTLKNYLVNAFKKMVLRPTIEAFVKPLAQTLTGALTGGAAQAGQGGGGGGISGLLSGASGLKNLFGGAGILGSSAAYGAAIGTTSIGVGSQAAMLAAQTGGFGASGLALTAQAGGGAMGAIGGAASGLMAAAPYIAVAALVVAALMKKTPGRQHEGGIYSSSGTDARSVATSLTGDAGYHDMLDRQNAGLMDFVKTTVDGTLTAAKGLAKTLGMSMALSMDAGFTANLNGQGAQKNSFGQAQIFDSGNLIGSFNNNRLDGDPTKGGAEFKAQLEEMVAAAILGGTEFVRAGETSLLAIKRLSSSLLTVNAVFDTLGKTLLESSLAGGDLASKLADAFGGLENFATATSTYYEAFYSEQERTATGVRQLTETLGRLGIALPNTGATDALAQYRALVDAQDINTEAGRATYAALVTLGGGFAQLVGSTQSLAAAAAAADQSVRNLADAANQLAQASANQLAARQLSAVQELNQFAQNAAQLTVDNAQKALDAAQSDLDAARAAEQQAQQGSARGAIEAVQNALKLQSDVLRETVSATRAVFETVRDAVRSLYSEVASTSSQAGAQGRAFIDAALSTALSTGYLPDASQLRDAIGAVTGDIGKAAYATRFEQERDQLVLAGKLSKLSEVSGYQLTEAERQLEALDDLMGVNSKQLDALGAINASVLSVSAALAAFTGAQSALTTAQTSQTAVKIQQAAVDSTRLQSGAFNTDGTVKTASGAVVGVSDFVGQTDAARAAAYLLRYPDVAASFASGNTYGMDAAEFASVHFALYGKKEKRQFAVGTNFVPYDMDARVHKGEMIVPAAYNPATSGVGGGNTERLERLVEVLTAEVQRLQIIGATGNRHAERTATVLDDSARGKQPLITAT